MSDVNSTTPHFKISRGSLLYALNENGQVTLNLDSGPVSVDLIGHLFSSNSRMPMYRGMIYFAPQMFELLQAVQVLIGSRKSITKSSELGKAIPVLLREIEEMMQMK